MKRSIIFAIALCALPAHGDEQQLANNILHTMTPIDSLPTRQEIEALFPPPDTVNTLAALARDDGMNTDFGVRLRAIRALPQFCAVPCRGTAPHVALVALLQELQDLPDQTGKTLLLVRATIESIGIAKSGDPNDVDLLLPFLDNPSRDIRAVTAFALRDLCDQAAVTPLRNRYNTEMLPTGVAQVRLAISEALRDLDTCP